MSQAPNKLLKRKWQDDDTLRHYTRLHNIKPVTVNTTAPNDYVFLKTKPKVRQLKEGKSIEVLTSQYKKRRMSTQEYIKLVHENLSHLTTQRNYMEYLNSIGQN